jgi:phospholipid transport system substrate-binding protein
MRLAFRLVKALAAAGTLLAFPAYAAVEDDASAVIENLHAALLEVAQSAPDSSLEQRVATLRPAVSEALDIERMGRLTVGRFWRSWTEDQRRAFIRLFERLSVTTYASRFAAIGPDTLEILGARAVDEHSAVVDALIHRPDREPVEFNYELRLEDGSWRIAQVRADGVSELGLMRSSYYAILESGGYAGLIESIESEIADFYDK